MPTRALVASMSVAALLAFAGAAQARPGVPRLIVSSSPLSDTSLVPSGVDPSERFTADFGELYSSPNGDRWIVAVSTNFSRVGVLAGQGLAFEVPFLADGFTQLPWTTVEEPDYYKPAVPAVSDSFDVDNGFYAINDAGDLAITVREANLSLKEMAKRQGGVWSRVARQGEDVPFDAGDEVYGGGFQPFGMSATGSDVYFRTTDTVGSRPTSQDDFYSIGPVTLQVGVSTVGGRVMDTLAGTLVDIRASANGSQYVLYANLSGATTDDDVIVRNGSIAIQEGTPLGAFSVVGNRLAGVNISGNGSWYSTRGQAAGTVDWVARNGVVVASKGQTLTPSTTDTWASFTGYSRTFLSIDVDNSGNYSVLGGSLSGATNTGVIVYNGETVLLRNGDGVDADGDGLADDDVFVDLNGGTGGELHTQMLGSDGYLYAVVRLRTSALAALGEGLVRVAIADVPVGCNLADITEVGGTAELPGNPDNQLTVDDVIVFVNLFSDGTGCPGAAPCSRADVCGVGGPPEPPEGELTVDDVIGFFNAFADGC